MSIKLKYTENNCYLDTSEKIFGIEIHYKGFVKIKSAFKDSALFMGSSSKIVIASITKDFDLSEKDLFTYEGDLKISSALCVPESLQAVYATIQSLVKPKTINGISINIENFVDNIESHKNVDKVFNFDKTEIITENLTTNESKLYYKDGTIYEGDYHMHGNGQAMSGAKHTEDSVYLYRDLKSIPNGEGRDLQLKSDISKKVKLITKKIRSGGSGGY
tara:strand:- start:4529 stop:5182 length:654 start_codon:yes stop_codon:yes gene_type:complete